MSYFIEVFKPDGTSVAQYEEVKRKDLGEAIEDMLECAYDTSLAIILREKDTGRGIVAPPREITYKEYRYTLTDAPGEVDPKSIERSLLENARRAAESVGMKLVPKGEDG